MHAPYGAYVHPNVHIPRTPLVVSLLIHQYQVYFLDIYAIFISQVYVIFCYLNFSFFPVEKHIGNGAFGRVYLADVTGISAFNPRKVLEEKSKQNRLSFFRNRKRNSYLYCTMIAKAAIKMLNGKVYILSLSLDFFSFLAMHGNY